MKIQFSVFLSVFVLFLGGAEYRIGDRAGVPWIMRDGILVSPRMVYVSRTAQEIATVGPQWKEFTLRFSILKSCDNAALHCVFSAWHSAGNRNRFSFPESKCRTHRRAVWSSRSGSTGRSRIPPLISGAPGNGRTENGCRFLWNLPIVGFRVLRTERSV